MDSLHHVRMKHHKESANGQCKNRWSANSSWLLQREHVEEAIGMLRWSRQSFVASRFSFRRQAMMFTLSVAMRFKGTTQLCGPRVEFWSIVRIDLTVKLPEGSCFQDQVSSEFVRLILEIWESISWSWCSSIGEDGGLAHDHSHWEKRPSPVHLSLTQQPLYFSSLNKSG